MAGPIVVKVGGAEGIDYGPLCDDIAEFVRSGQRIVLVHGGSESTSRLSEQLGFPPTFIRSPGGQVSRRTDRNTIDAMIMACAGRLNKRLVVDLLRIGINAIGLCGLDAAIWRAERKSAIRSLDEEGRIQLIKDDYSGRVIQVNARLLNALLEAGLTPVIAPPALSEQNEPVNIDADRAAAQTAIALNASAFVLLSNVPGLMQNTADPSTLICSVDSTSIESARQAAKGRMKNKVLAAEEAIEREISRVIIGDARVDHPIGAALSGAGTQFTGTPVSC